MQRAATQTINKYFYGIIKAGASEDLQLISADYRWLFRFTMQGAEVVLNVVNANHRWMVPR